MMLLGSLAQLSLPMTRRPYCILSEDRPSASCTNFWWNLGLTPQVLLEPQGEDKDQLWVCSLSAYEDIDWITLFLSESAKLKCISKQCDLTIHNFGCMLVVVPQLFRYCDQDSLSSTMGQCGSINNLRPLQDGQNGSSATCIYVPDDPNASVQQ